MLFHINKELLSLGNVIYIQCWRNHLRLLNRSSNRFVISVTQLSFIRSVFINFKASSCCQQKDGIVNLSVAMTADIISRLKLSKSPGSDGYTTLWYKEFQNELIPVILPILKQALKKAQTPPSWKEVIISAIPKVG